MSNATPSTPSQAQAERQRRLSEHGSAFGRLILDHAFERRYHADGSYELVDMQGRPAAVSLVEQKIAGEEATIRVYRRQVVDSRAAWKAWQRSQHPMRPRMDTFVGEARYALTMWRKHRADLARLRKELAGLTVPVLQAAE